MSYITPFEAVHKQLGANFGDFAGWTMPSDFGDVEAELAAVDNAIAAFDLSSFGRISVSGAQSDDLIASLAGEDADKLLQDQWIWSKVGENDNIIRIANTEKGYFIFTQPAQRQATVDLIVKTAQKNDVDNVKITDITEKTGMLALYGPNAVAVIKKILPIDIGDLEQGSVMCMSFFMMSLTILRGSWLGIDGLELMCPKSAAALAAGAISKYHDRYNIKPAGMVCLQKALSQKNISISVG